MAEYIEREALYELLKDEDRCGYLDRVDVASVQAADVATVRHGKWEKYFHSYFGRHQCVCSECKNDDYWKKNFCYGYEKYCPNCGADMRGEQE